MMICIPITFYNLLKSVFQKEISHYNPDTPDTNCKSIFLFEKLVFNNFLNMIGAKNQLPITFCSDLMRNKTLKARNLTPTYTNI